VTLVEQELFTLPYLPSSTRVFSGIRVAHSLIFGVVFCRPLLVFILFLLLGNVLSVLLRFTPFLYLQTFVNERMIVVEQHVKIVSRYIMARTSYCLIR